MTWYPPESDCPDTIEINGATFVKEGEYVKYPPMGMTKQNYTSKGIRLTRSTYGYHDRVTWEAHLTPRNRTIIPNSRSCSSPGEAVAKLREYFDHEIADYKDQLSWITATLRSLEEDGKGLMELTNKESV